MAVRIELGKIVITRGAQDGVHADDVAVALTRHSGGDWGEVDPEDRATNDAAAVEGCRVLSVYRDRGGTRFWIITEADRSVTTILLPDEY